MADDASQPVAFVLGAIVYAVACFAAFFLLALPAAVILGALGLVAGAGAGLGLLGLRLARGPAQLDVPSDRSVAPNPESPAGIEPAWRSYLVGQSRSDAEAAVEEVRAVVERMFRALGAATLKRGSTAAALWPAVLLPYTFTVMFAVGAGGAVVVSGIVVGVPTGVWWVLRTAGVRGQNALHERSMRAGHLAATCTRPGCDEVTELPVVECGCGALHHQLRPGDYGAFRRRCTCGVLLPTTVDAVARPLRLRCPRCLDELPDDALVGADVRLVVFGAAGAGASRFVAAGLTTVVADVERAGGSVEPRGTDAQHPKRLRDCRTLRIDLPRPVGRRVGTLHVYDSPGAVYEDPVLRVGLNHLWNAQGFVLVIDPTRLPRIAARVGTEERIVNPEHCYWSVVNELRNQRVPLQDRALAVVITRTDELEHLLPGRGVAPGAKRIREWASAMGLENLLLAADRDFGVVRHFAVAAPGVAAPSAADVLRWLADEAGLRLPRSRAEAG
jgi:hypothetical protein